MIQKFIAHLLELCLLVLLQTTIFNQIHLFGLFTPMVYVAFLLHFPLGTSRVSLLLWGFAIGLLTDIAANTPGMGCAAMTLTAMLRPGILSLLIQKDVTEDTVPSFQSIGTWEHVRFILLTVLIHHFVFFALEFSSAHHPVKFLLSFAGSALLTIILILAIERLRNHKKKGSFHGA